MVMPAVDVIVVAVVVNFKIDQDIRFMLLSMLNDNAEICILAAH